MHRYAHLRLHANVRANAWTHGHLRELRQQDPSTHAVVFTHVAVAHRATVGVLRAASPRLDMRPADGREEDVVVLLPLELVGGGDLGGHAWG